MCLFASARSRQAWALVSEVGGGNASCSEDVREHENHDTGGRAVASRSFTTVDGVGFLVTAYSEWKNGEQLLSSCGSTVLVQPTSVLLMPSIVPIISLAHESKKLNDCHKGIPLTGMIRTCCRCSIIQRASDEG